MASYKQALLAYEDKRRGIKKRFLDDFQNWKEELRETADQDDDPQNMLDPGGFLGKLAWLCMAFMEAEMSAFSDLLKHCDMKATQFSEELENFWQELKKMVEEKKENGKIRYWDFVGAETYEETVHRAFMTSFLVTYGYATLEIHPLEEEKFIKPHERIVTEIGEKQLVSIPIAITVEDWMEWKRGELR